MIVRLTGMGLKKKHRAEPKYEPVGDASTASPYIPSMFAPPPGRGNTLASAYQYRDDVNMVAQPMTGHTIGRGLSRLSEKLQKLSIPKLNQNKSPDIRF